MSGTEDRIKGKANEVMGEAKSKIGDAIDDREMHAKGKMQEMKGKAQGMVGEAKDRLDGHDDADEIKDNARDNEVNA